MVVIILVINLNDLSYTFSSSSIKGDGTYYRVYSETGQKADDHRDKDVNDTGTRLLVTKD